MLFTLLKSEPADAMPFVVLRLLSGNEFPKPKFNGDITMRRVFIPALLAVALIATSTSTASAGIFGHFCNSGCDNGCDMEPACGCEMPAPACGCEVVEPCCDSPCGKPKFGLLKKLFSCKANACCDSGCEVLEPACGCEVIEPACGCEMAAPACGCEVVDPCCDAPKCGHKLKGLFGKLFGKRHCGCDMEPACGCEMPAPTCGCEVIEPSCGCGF
jgi:hypothetical protein